MNDSPRYKLTLDLNVLNHLGLNLYSNTAAALSEAVANAWDADAAEVTITLEDDAITIRDTGIGMTVDEINRKFLAVGYDRRGDAGEETAGGRRVMGRKGIGKLALFSIAEEITVLTRRAGASPEGFIMSVSAIQEAIQSHGEYNPTPIEPPSDLAVGTVIRLSRLKNRNLGRTRLALRRRLARRFAVIGTREFTVTIDGDPVTYRDRDDLKAVQFLWQIGQPLQQNPQYSEVDFTDDRQFPHFFRHTDPTVNVINPTLVHGTIPDTPDWNVRGWIGTAKSPSDLKSPEDSRINSLNSIVVIARGRLIQEDILPAISEARIVRQYLTGQIEADFLDLTNQVDIATSDRQRIREDDPRYQALLTFVNGVVKEIAGKWTNYRGEVGTREALRTYPPLVEWLGSFEEPRIAGIARQMITRIMALPLDDESDRATFLRQAIFAFERIQVRGQLESFVTSLGNLDQARLAFETLDGLEAVLYAEIVRTRLGIIDVLETLVDDRARERAFQEHLYKHLWLLDPSWERATDSPIMERTFRGMLAEAEQRDNLRWGDNRVDIQYVTTAGLQVIIELKRADRPMKTLELMEQGGRYRRMLAEVLAMHTASPADSAPRTAADYEGQIDVVFVLGDWPENPEGDRRPPRAAEILRTIRGRVVTYNQLVGNARKAYDAYLREHARVSHVQQITDALLAPPAPALVSSTTSDNDRHHD